MTGQTLKEVSMGHEIKASKGHEIKASKGGEDHKSPIKSRSKMPKSELSQKSQPAHKSRNPDRENQVSPENVLGFGYDIPSFFKVPQKAAG
jgi:hypothetical protein